MPRKNSVSRTLKQVKQPKKNLTSSFLREISTIFLELLLTIKLYHWKTYSYATHKATDELYSKLNENIDHFIEILLGKVNERIDLHSTKKIELNDLKTKESLIRYIEDYKAYLVDLDNNKFMKLMTNSDLYNIRDEILGDLNQFLYLLSLD